MGSGYPVTAARVQLTFASGAERLPSPDIAPLPPTRPTPCWGPVLVLTGWHPLATRSRQSYEKDSAPRPQPNPPGPGKSAVKVVVQVPCLNEEETLPLVFEHMPRQIPGVDSLEFLVIDDGSPDRTVEVARQLGVTALRPPHPQHGPGPVLPRRRSLKALEMGADIVVNTDGDNQYPSDGSRT